MTIEEREQRAGELFKAGYNCCQAVAMTFADVIGLPEDEVARLTSGFGGGMLRYCIGHDNGGRCNDSCK